MSALAGAPAFQPPPRRRWRIAVLICVEADQRVTLADWPADPRPLEAQAGVLGSGFVTKG